MSNPSKRKILVVDDDPGVREVMAMLLMAAGYDVAVAEDGFGALAQLRTTLPEVIVCDLEMPRMTGVELLSAVRRRFPQILTVAMSGSYAGDELPPGVIADGYFAKGGSPRSLSTVVEQLIRSAPARGDEQPQESALA